MADEIHYNINMGLANGSLLHEMKTGTITEDQAAKGLHATVVSVGTSEEAMPTGDISTLGFLMLKNISTTGYVTWGPSVAGVMTALGRLEPGSSAGPFRLDPDAVIYWKSSAGTVQVQMALYED